MGKFIEVRDESGYRTSIQIEKIICIEELEFPRYHNGCNTKITTTEKGKKQMDYEVSNRILWAIRNIRHKTERTNISTISMKFNRADGMTATVRFDNEIYDFIITFDGREIPSVLNSEFVFQWLVDNGFIDKNTGEYRATES